MPRYNLKPYLIITLNILNYIFSVLFTIIYVYINIGIYTKYIDLYVSYNFILVQIITYIYFLIVELNILYYNIFYKLKYQIINDGTNNINKLLNKKFKLLVIYYTICIIYSCIHTILVYLKYYETYFIMSLLFLIFKISIATTGHIIKNKKKTINIPQIDYGSI